MPLLARRGLKVFRGGRLRCHAVHVEVHVGDLVGGNLAERAGNHAFDEDGVGEGGEDLLHEVEGDAVAAGCAAPLPLGVGEAFAHQALERIAQVKLPRQVLEADVLHHDPRDEAFEDATLDEVTAQMASRGRRPARGIDAPVDVLADVQVLRNGEAVGAHEPLVLHEISQRVQVARPSWL